MKPELLSPAGNLETLKVAFAYGADAVYLSGKQYGLRAKADNFTLDEIREGVSFAHGISKKVYVTLNIIPHNDDLTGLDGFVKELEKISVDGVIVSDPGVISIVQETSPSMPIHLSTQANNTNFKSAAFWHKLGIKRITLARELSFKEVQEIIEKTPKPLELEVFVHGSICISYSGRCMLSAYMIGRDANRGDCAHPCRWSYALEEEKRPGEYQDVFEDEHGTYIFNSKDLCLIEHIPQLIKAGVGSFKIEGRMKSAYYVAAVTGAYRTAIDESIENPAAMNVKASLFQELTKTNHRQYSTGFFLGPPKSDEYIYDSTGYSNSYAYLGLVVAYDAATRMATVRQQNKLVRGDVVEVIGPGREFFTQTIDEMYNEEGVPIEAAPHPQQLVSVKMKNPVRPLDMLRKQEVSYAKNIKGR